jgi:hypothetical protein
MTRRTTIALLGSLALGGLALGAFSLRAKHLSPEKGARHLEVFLRTGDAAATHTITNSLALMEQLPDTARLDAYVLSSATPAKGDEAADALARCAVEQGAAKGLRFVLCRQSMGQGNEDWAACAEESGLAKHALDACATGGESATLAARVNSEVAKHAVSDTPAVFVDGKRVEGGATRESLSSAICGETKSTSGLCSPAAVQARGFPIVVMTDARCPDCRAPFWFRRMQMLFPSADISIVDVKTAAGRAQYDQVSPGLLPAVVLNREVEADPGFARIERQLVKKDAVYLLSPATVRPEFDPTKAN